MSKRARGQSKSNSPNEASREGGSSFAWEFGADEKAAPSISSPGTAAAARANTRRPPAASAQNGADEIAGDGMRAQSASVANRGEFGSARANYVRDQLDRALDRWWASGALPPLALVRDGLLMLEAGATASESQRTLLLRAALAYDRGVQTALRHQVDAERVALVLALAVVEWEVPLDPARLNEFVRNDEQVRRLLIAELKRSTVLLTGVARLRAQTALESLVKDEPTSGSPYELVPPPPPLRVLPPRRLIRQILLGLLLATIVGFVVWQQRHEVPEGMIAMPAASYALLAADGVNATGQPLAAFLIDRYEVTNREYRTCIEAGKCVWPVKTSSATRADYFTDPAFNDYPVVNVTQNMAATYCGWQGKRLPTASEWQAAASVSPANGQAFRYPWGQSFDAQRTNSLREVAGETLLGDTMAVGSFRPNGDSPSGAADMAGNVAEWTATGENESADDGITLVKGGSFADDEEALFVGHGVPMAISQANTQIGFRCALNYLSTS